MSKKNSKIKKLVKNNTFNKEYSLETSEEEEALIRKYDKTYIEDNACPECGCEVGEIHNKGCDLAKCAYCHTQVFLGCECGRNEDDKWNGYNSLN
jgi:hypothetical protein